MNVTKLLAEATAGLREIEEVALKGLEGIKSSYHRRLVQFRRPWSKVENTVEGWKTVFEELSDFLEEYYGQLKSYQADLGKLEAVGLKDIEDGLYELLVRWGKALAQVDRLSLGGLEATTQADLGITPLDKAFIIAYDDLLDRLESLLREVKERVTNVVPASFEHKGFRVIPKEGLSRKQLSVVLEGIESATSALKRKKFGKLVYGDFILTSQTGGMKDATGKAPAGGFYSVRDDHFVAFPGRLRTSDSLAELIIHELGHRYYYKFLRDSQRFRWEDTFAGIFKSGPGEKLYRELVKEYEYITVKDRERWWKNLETKKAWGSYFAFTYKIEKKYGGQDNVKLMFWIDEVFGDQFGFQEAFQYEVPYEGEWDSAKEVKGVWRAYKSVDMRKDRKKVAELKKKFVDKAKGDFRFRRLKSGSHEDDVIRQQVVDELGVDASVSEYGITNPSEDFAETFQAYVLGQRIPPGLKYRFEATLREHRERLADLIVEARQLLG